MDDQAAAKAYKAQLHQAAVDRANHVKWVGTIAFVLTWILGAGFKNAVLCGAVSALVFGALHVYQGYVTGSPRSVSMAGPSESAPVRRGAAIDDRTSIFNEVPVASIASVRVSGRPGRDNVSTATNVNGAHLPVGNWNVGLDRVSNIEELDVLLASNRGASRGSALSTTDVMTTPRVTTTTANTPSPFAVGFGIRSPTDGLRGRGESTAAQWNFGVGMQGPAQQPSNAVRGFHMRFNDARRAADGSAVDAAPAEWSRLGVRDLGASTGRMKEWVRDCLASIATDIRTCDRYFAERQMLFCDCSTSLNEMMEVPKTAATTTTAASGTTGAFGTKPATGFGTGATTTGAFSAVKPATGFGTTTGTGTTGAFGAAKTGFGAASTTTGTTGSSFGGATHVKRVDYLMQEKARVAATAQHLPDGYKLASMIDRRLQLDALLMVNLTFPEADRTAEAQTHRQSYVVRRITALASQPSLAGYRHDGGDPDVWVEGLPTDPQIIAHVLRYYHNCFARHIRLAHDAPQDASELSLCIGHCGAPYFFVRYRQPPVDKTYHTTPGRDSLFHALLLLTGIVATFHEGAYGGIFGVIDLEKLKLSHVL